MRIIVRLDELQGKNIKRARASQRPHIVGDYATSWSFTSRFRPKMWISFFVQNAKFRDFVSFSSNT